MNTVQYHHPLCPNIVTAVLLLYMLWTGPPPRDLCLSMCKEFGIQGTISYVVFQNIVITAVQIGRSTPVAQLAPRNLLTRWDVSSIPANGIFLTKN